ncbi:hypothetical protein GQ457_09G027690 [Hibiscus cannabinus]
MNTGDVNNTSSGSTKMVESGQFSKKTSQAMNLNATAVAMSHNEKPSKFTGQNFKTWQQKKLFYLTMLNLAKYLNEDSPVVTIGDKEGEIASLSTIPDYLIMEVNSKFGSILSQVMWRVEVLKAVDDAKSESNDGNGEISKVTWRIPNFSSFKKDQRLFSEHFSVDGNKWQLSIYPKGNKLDHLSIHLRVADSATLPSGWTRFAQYGFAVIDQVDRTNSIAEVTTDEFNAAALLSLSLQSQQRKI